MTRAAARVASIPCRAVSTFVRFRVGDDELGVAFTVALELAERAARAPDDAGSAAARIRAAGASRPIRLSAELAALACVIDAWEIEVVTVRRLRGRLP